MQKITMKDLPVSEQPYELLEMKGEASLTDAQLLAIILKTGSNGERAVDLATRLLASVPTQGRAPLVALCHQSLRTLQQHKGIGRVKAIQIRALAELCVRISRQKAVNRLVLDTPQSIVQIYMEEMRYQTQEIIKAVFFNAKMELLGDQNLSLGTMTQSLLSPREIFLSAWERGAYSFILLHNHPSGNPAPSLNDIMLTDQLKQAAKLLEIPMLDHIILGDGRYYSFREHENIKREK